MKILFIHHRYHTNLFNWFRGFLENGHEVKLLVYKGDDVNESDLPRSIRFEPSKSSLKKMQKNPRTRGDGVDSFSPYYYPSLKDLYGFLKEYRPDLMVIRPAFTRYAYRLLFLAIWFRCKIVLHSRILIHRDFSKSKLGIFNLGMGILRAHWMSPCKGNPTVFSKPSEKLVYLPFTTKPQYTSREFFAGKRINILCVAKYFRSKNPRLMLEVFLKLRRSFPSIHLTICGTGQEHGAYYQEMLELKNSYEFKDSINLLINQPFTRMKELYQAHDLFVLPTSHDPASYTVLEAMSYGLAVITTSVDGSAGYLKPEVNGYVIERRNEEALHQKLNLLLESPEKISAMGLKSLELINENHVPKKVTEEFLKMVVP